MSTEKKVALFVRPLTGFNGDAALYRLEPPIESGEYVVVSATDLPSIAHIDPTYRTSETMVFPSDGESVSDWGELAFVPYRSHADALADLGYEVKS
jgi:hypothetical protein